jgi:hypothetical protein
VIGGFIGVAIVLQPGNALFRWAALLPLVMAVGAAFYRVLAPIVARVENPAISIYFLGMIGAASMSAVVPFYWTQPDALGWSMLLVIGVLGTIGHLLIVRAFAHAPAATLAPFFYVHLIWRRSTAGSILATFGPGNDHRWRADHRRRHLHLSNAMTPRRSDKQGKCNGDTPHCSPENRPQEFPLRTDSHRSRHARCAYCISGDSARLAVFDGRRQQRAKPRAHSHPPGHGSRGALDGALRF